MGSGNWEHSSALAHVILSASEESRLSQATRATGKLISASGGGIYEHKPRPGFNGRHNFTRLVYYEVATDGKLAKRGDGEEWCVSSLRSA